MSLRFLPVLALAGCWPHETRRLTEPEERLVDRMIEEIAEHARRTADPVDRSVLRAVEEARREGRISVFEDGVRSDGQAKQGAVVLGHLYLHSSLLADPERAGDRPYALMMLYHEGVHLTQSSCALVFTPEVAEQEAETGMRRFRSAWRSDLGYFRRYPEGAANR